MCCATTSPGHPAGTRDRTLAMASVPPVDAPIASTVPGAHAEAAQARGRLRLWLRRRLYGSRRTQPGRRRGTHLARQIVPQLAHRVRPARLRQHVHGAIFQRPESRRAGWLRQTADHDRRQRMEMHQLLQKRQPVHARHLDIQRQHIRPQRQDLVPRHVGIRRRAHDLDIRLPRQRIRQNAPHDRRIVDNQDAYSAVAGHIRLSI